jgi:hypothetical protein
MGSGNFSDNFNGVTAILIIAGIMILGLIGFLFGHYVFGLF